MNSMSDWKPVVTPGYTGEQRRHDDLPLSQEDHKYAAIGIVSFICGMMFFAIIDLLLRVTP